MRKAVSWSPKLWPEEGGSADTFNLYIYTHTQNDSYKLLYKLNIVIL